MIISRGTKRTSALYCPSEGLRCGLSVILAAVLLVASGRPVAAAETSDIVAKPNFIVINIDDLGYGDIGPFGSTRNRTPNLDRMAQEGRKLTSFYAAPARLSAACSVTARRPAHEKKARLIIYSLQSLCHPKYMDLATRIEDMPFLEGV